jgi:hypothetical protein
MASGIVSGMVKELGIPTPDELATMTDTAFKVIENKARRMAERQGLELMKSRRRDPRATDFGTYKLIAAGTGELIYGATTGYGLTLTEIYAYLIGEDA